MAAAEVTEAAGAEVIVAVEAVVLDVDVEEVAVLVAKPRASDARTLTSYTEGTAQFRDP